MIEKILAVARAEIGTKEFPANSNNVKYNTWFYGRPISGKDYSWCGVFVSWVFDRAGCKLGTVDFLRGFASCPYAIAKVFKWGQVIPRAEVKPGDVIFFDWERDGRWDHTGIFMRDLGNNIFESIEGNTSLGDNSNGGEVMLRQRRYSVAMFVRPNVLLPFHNHSNYSIV